MSGEVLNTVLLYSILILTLVVAIVDIALTVAMLTMLRGLHIMYAAISQEVKDNTNLIQFVARSSK